MTSDESHPLLRKDTTTDQKPFNISWEPSTDLEKIAVAIGHHFWNVEKDKDACWLGMDCAKEVVKALNA